MQVLYFWIGLIPVTLLAYWALTKKDYSGDGGLIFFFMVLPCAIGFGIGGTVALTEWVHPVIFTVYLALFSGLFYLYSIRHSGPYLIIAMSGASATVSAALIAIYKLSLC